MKADGYSNVVLDWEIFFPDLLTSLPLKISNEYLGHCGDGMPQWVTLV